MCVGQSLYKSGWWDLFIAGDGSGVLRGQVTSGSELTGVVGILKYSTPCLIGAN